MEEIKNSYALQRYSEKIKSAPLLENNKELLLKFIEQKAQLYQWSNGRKYATGFTMLINVIKEVNDIDPKAELKKFNTKQRSRFMTVLKPMD